MGYPILRCLHSGSTPVTAVLISFVPVLMLVFALDDVRVFFFTTTAVVTLPVC